MKLNSIRFKTSVLFTCILCVVLIAFSTSVYLTVGRILYRNLDKNLQIKAGKLANVLNAHVEVEGGELHPLPFMEKPLSTDEDEVGVPSVIDKLWEADIKTLNLEEDYIQVVNKEAQAVMISSNLSPETRAILNEKIAISYDKPYFEDIREKGIRARVIHHPFVYAGQIPMVIQLSTPLEPVTKILEEMLIFIVISIVAILIFTSFLGNFLTKSILKPVVAVTDMANRISHKDLSLRIEEKEVDHELKVLISSFNMMIERLGKSFAHINEFSSHVAHELKTPLAIIKGETEIALSEARDADEYKRVLTVGMEETERLISVIKDLLLLARLEYRPDAFKFENINLSEFIQTLYEQTKVLAVPKQITIDLKVPAKSVVINGDKTHLRRLVINLIDNAVKYTPEQGKVRIALSENDKDAHIEVSDTGIGISQEDSEKVFDKFFRIRKDDKSAEHGTGLGLSIAQAIAVAHQGSIIAKGHPAKGSTFRITLPLAL